MPMVGGDAAATPRGTGASRDAQASYEPGTAVELVRTGRPQRSPAVSLAACVSDPARLLPDWRRRAPENARAPAEQLHRDAAAMSPENVELARRLVGLTA